MLTKQEIVEKLKNHGFAETKSPKTKTIGFESGQQTVYLKATTVREPLVIHPDNQNRFGSLEAIPGVSCERPLRFYHVSSMRAFPSRVNEGKGATKYGIAFDFLSFGALEQFLDILGAETPSTLLDDLEAIGIDDIQETERTELKKTRVGQGKFRDRLMEEFGGRCPLTLIDQPDLLRASHIKPWKDSDSSERLDPENGLLLAANADALFDKGYITFDSAGQMLISTTIGRTGIEAFGLKQNMRIELSQGGRRDYLSYHRNNVFISNSEPS